MKEHKHNFFLSISAIQCRSRSPELLRSTSHVGNTVESCTSGFFYTGFARITWTIQLGKWSNPAGKVVRPWPDQPDRFRRPCSEFRFQGKNQSSDDIRTPTTLAPNSSAATHRVWSEMEKDAHAMVFGPIQGRDPRE